NFEMTGILFRARSPST
ncbi:hypothetical protein SSYM_0851, partial [Serratia symbiotica str. Tucson]